MPRTPRQPIYVFKKSITKSQRKKSQDTHVFNCLKLRLSFFFAVPDGLGFCFLTIRIGNPVFRREYLPLYPGDPKVNDLDNLHEYEKLNPKAFRDMYQFWCCRKGSVTVKSPPAWFCTAGLS